MKPAELPAVTVGFNTAAGERAEIDVPVGPGLSRTYWQNVRLRVARDPYTMVCVAVLLLIAGAALFAPWLGLADPAASNTAKRSTSPHP